MNKQTNHEKYIGQLVNSSEILVFDEYQTFRDQSLMKKNLFAPQLYGRKRNNRITSIYNKIIATNAKDDLYPSKLVPKTLFSSYNNQNPNLSARKQKIEKMSERTVQKFVGELVTSITNNKQTDELSNKNHQQKINLLKRIIEHYNIKSMAYEHSLSNSILKEDVNKSYGLTIENINTDKLAVKKNLHPRSNTLKNTRIGIRTSQGSRKQQKTHSLEPTPMKCVTIKQQQSKQFQQILNSEEFSNNFIRLKKSKKAKLSPKNITKLNLTQKLRKNQQNRHRLSSVRKQFKYSIECGTLESKVRKYRQFLYVLNFSNNMYRELDIQKYQTPYKYYIGSGNNANLIRSIMRKRFWLQETNDINECNFAWTQIKKEQFFENQQYFGEQEDSSQNNIDLLKEKIIQDLKSNNNFYQKNNKMLESLNDPYLRLISQKNNKEYNLILEQLSYRKHCKYIDRRKYIKKQITILEEIWSKQKVHNHLPMNGYLGNKKAMFYCLREYYGLIKENIFQVVPLTYHIKKGFHDEQFKQFMKVYLERKKFKKYNIWIMKPGQFSNRGQGISCSSKIQQIRKRVGKTTLSQKKSLKPSTIIIQSYIMNPLLYNFRKFDIRAYMLVTCHNGKYKAYWYQQGYVRTSSYPWNTSCLEDTSIHLTNDAIQKHCQEYGKYQPGNKLSYQQLQRYLDSLPANGRNMNIFSNLYPQMKSIATDTIRSTFLFLDKRRLLNNFQIFGLDFMIDDRMKVWLIQVNTNPCLELSCPLLQRIIPHMVQNAIRISVDTIFPPPSNLNSTYRYIIPENALHYNKFELIFDEDRDGKEIKKLYQGSKITTLIDDIQEDKDQYIQNGVQLDLQNL